MKRRRSRSAFDVRALFLAGVGVLFLPALIVPGLAFVEAGALGFAALALWYFGARRRLTELHQWAGVANMYALSPEQFEHHVAATYAALGYNVSVTRRVGDQGIDVLAERGTERLGIQCKRTTEPVSNSAVQEVYAGKAHYRCNGAAVISLGGFTAPARALAASTSVELVDGKSYADLFHRATAARPGRSVWAVVPHARAVLSALTCAAVAVVVLAMGSMRTTIPISNEGLRSSQVDQMVETTPAATVARFYSAINDKDFRFAYNLLSPSFKKGMTFDSFRSGYATTVNVTATTADDDNGPVVRVHLVATDRNGNGSNRTTTYDGYWRVIADPASTWVLDDGRFHRS